MNRSRGSRAISEWTINVRDSVIAAVTSIEKMRQLSTIAAVCALLFAGCDRVTVDEPFGDPPRKDHLETLRGNWFDVQGDVYHVETTDGDSLVVGITTWSPKQKRFVTRNIHMTIRHVGCRPLLFLPADEGSERFTFVWLSEVDRNLLKGRVPDPEAFRSAVERGQVVGEVASRKNDHFDVHLRATDELLSRLSGPNGPSYFETEKDSPLQRVASEAGG